MNQVMDVAPGDVVDADTPAAMPPPLHEPDLGPGPVVYTTPNSKPKDLADADDDAADSTYVYRDLANVPASELNSSSKYSCHTRVPAENLQSQKLPAKLVTMLADPALADIIAWQPHGRSWKILNRDMLCRYALPHYFEHSNYQSFVRIVNAWGFRRIVAGRDRDTYYHEMFLRGMPHLHERMKRIPTDHKKAPIEKEDKCPDFYELAKVSPLPEVPMMESSELLIIMSKVKSEDNTGTMEDGGGKMPASDTKPKKRAASDCSSGQKKKRNGPSLFKTPSKRVSNKCDKSAPPLPTIQNPRMDAATQADGISNLEAHAPNAASFRSDDGRNSAPGQGLVPSGAAGEDTEQNSLLLRLFSGQLGQNDKVNTSHQSNRGVASAPTTQSDELDNYHLMMLSRVASVNPQASSSEQLNQYVAAMPASQRNVQVQESSILAALLASRNSQASSSNQTHQRVSSMSQTTSQGDSLLNGILLQTNAQSLVSAAGIGFTGVNNGVHGLNQDQMKAVPSMSNEELSAAILAKIVAQNNSDRVQSQQEERRSSYKTLDELIYSVLGNGNQSGANSNLTMMSRLMLKNNAQNVEALAASSQPIGQGNVPLVLRSVLQNTEQKMPRISAGFQDRGKLSNATVVPSFSAQPDNMKSSNLMLQVPQLLSQSQQQSCQALANSLQGLVEMGQQRQMQTFLQSQSRGENDQTQSMVDPAFGGASSSLSHVVQPQSSSSNPDTSRSLELISRKNSGQDSSQRQAVPLNGLFGNIQNAISGSNTAQRPAWLHNDITTSLLLTLMRSENQANNSSAPDMNQTAGQPGSRFGGQFGVSSWSQHNPSNR